VSGPTPYNDWASDLDHAISDAKTAAIMLRLQRDTAMQACRLFVAYIDADEAFAANDIIIPGKEPGTPTGEAHYRKEYERVTAKCVEAYNVAKSAIASAEGGAA
jgi:hypothetical protein